MTDEIKEIREMVKLTLKNMDIDEKDCFFVEGINVDLDIITEEDTLLPVIALYCNHMSNVLFKNTIPLYSQKIYKTRESLFFVKMDTQKNTENDLSTRHMKLLLIGNFFKSLIKKENNQVELSYLIEKWRKVFDKKNEKEEISILSSNFNLSLTLDEISEIFEPIHNYYLL